MAHKYADPRPIDELDSAYKSKAGTFSPSQGVPVVSNHMIVMGRVSYEVCYKCNSNLLFPIFQHGTLTKWKTTMDSRCRTMKT